MSRNQDGNFDNEPGNVLWTCGICNKEYKSEVWFNKHMAQKHSEIGGGEAAVSTASDLTQHSGLDQHHISPCVPFYHTSSAQECPDFDKKSPLQIPHLTKKEWDFHNSELEALLAISVKVGKANAVDEIKVFDELVYDYFKHIFGVKSSSLGGVQQLKENLFKRRLRKKKRDLRKQLKKAKMERNSHLSHELARAYRSLLKLIQEVSNNRKRQQQDFCRSKNEALFDKDKFGYVKTKLESVKGELKFSKEQAEEYFRETYSDIERDVKYSSFDCGSSCEVVHRKISTPTQEDVVKILKKKRNKSAPGPNGIPYLVYKNCPILQKYLFTFFKFFWSAQVCPQVFGNAIVKLIPKKEVCDNPSEVRPIALTNTHGKVFFSIVADRVSKHMECNKLFHSSIQKGFKSGVSGCLEHTALMTEVLNDARKHERQIFVAWLDLGNAFGSVKHNLLQFALAYFQVPDIPRKLILSYYDTLCLKISTHHWESTLIRFETGTFQGCCFSPVGFNVVFNLLLLSLLKNVPRNGQYVFRKGQELVIPHCLAFADDLTVLCRTKKVMCSLLAKVEEFCCWSKCLKVKPAKCRSLCLARRNTVFGPINPGLVIDGQMIEEISSGSPFKFLGKFFQFEGKPDLNHAVNTSFKTDLAKVDNLPLSGPRKVWIYNNVLIPKLSWPLLVYECNKQTIFHLEAEATATLKSWLGLRKSMDPSILYRSENNFGFGLKKISVLNHQSAVTRSQLLASSKDPMVREVTVSSRLDLSSLRQRVTFDDMFVKGASRHREGLGWRQSKEKSETEKMRTLVREEDEEHSMVHAHSLSMQHDWLILGESCVPPKLMWTAFLYEWSPEMIKFYSNALQCTLPDPSNLRRWGLSEDDSCGLCRRGPASALHVLAGCPVALTEGRYTWRHDRILGILREAVSLSIARAKRGLSTTQEVQTFVKPGEKAKKNSSSGQNPSIFRNSSDWVICMDVGNRHYEFPPELAVTSLCPDMTVFSKHLKSAVLVELTVPWDTNIPKQHDYKLNKYADLCSNIRLNGFKCILYAVEVGARGLTAKSLFSFLKELGLGKKDINSFLKRASKTAVESSYRLWLRRNCTWTQRGDSCGHTKDP